MKSFGLFPDDIVAVLTKFCDTYANELADETYVSLAKLELTMYQEDFRILITIADWINNDIDDDALVNVINAMK